jgi:deoxyribodipyrimidine photo-lyase
MDDLFSDQLAGFFPELNRSAGLAQLEMFASKAGGAYAKGRNYDLGPGHHHMVSRLSSHLRRRLITEDEVISAILTRHSFSSAEKFITEIYWRTYFKGWLEMRPTIWQQWLSDCDLLPRAPALAQACSGQTGIDCFDAWTDELKSSGYIHNHARMWFASIWIFTLGLSWQHGAEFFMKYLRDGDPASNTLAWRWVAGLQTRGKAYAARADNIEQFTRGRFFPRGQLNEQIHAVDGMENPPAQPLNFPALMTDNQKNKPYLLLLSTEDGHPESLLLANPPVAAVTLPVLFSNHFRPVACNWMRSAELDQMEQTALTDIAQRAQSHFDLQQSHMFSLGPDNQTARPADDTHILEQAAEQLAGLCRQYKVFDLVTAYMPVGFWASNYQRLRDHPLLAGKSWHLILRDFDRLTWPSATKGFFPFKSKIPRWLRQS